MTNFAVFISLFDILSKLVALLFARLETPSKNSLRVNGAPNSDSNFPQLLSIKSFSSWSVRVEPAEDGGPKRDEKWSLHSSGPMNAESSVVLRSKEPFRKDFTMFIYPRGFTLCRMSISLKSAFIKALGLDFTNFLYFLDSDWIRPRR